MNGSSSAQGKLVAVEGIRGLACLAVVFSHLGLSFYPYLHNFDPSVSKPNSAVVLMHHSPFAFWYSGTAAVYIFFVLSGFILSYVIQQSRNPRSKLYAMMIKRYPRLAIPALVSCILLWAVMALTDLDASRAEHWLQVLATQPIQLSQALYEGSFGSFLFAEASVNWVLWTMQVELIGSFMLFGLLFLYQLKPKLFLPSIFIATILGVWIIHDQALYFGLVSFLAGALIFFYGQPIRSRAVAYLLLGLGLYCAGVHNTSLSYQWLYLGLGEQSYPTINFLAGPLVVYSILMSPDLSRLMDHGICLYLGKISFAIYLLHLMLIYLVCLPVFNLLLNVGASYDVAALLAIVLCLISIILLADLYTRSVDQFAIRFSNGLAKKLLSSSSVS